MFLLQFLIKRACNMILSLTYCGAMAQSSAIIYTFLSQCYCSVTITNSIVIVLHHPSIILYLIARSCRLAVLWIR